MEEKHTVTMANMNYSWPKLYESPAIGEELTGSTQLRSYYFVTKIAFCEDTCAHHVCDSAQILWLALMHHLTRELCSVLLDPSSLGCDWKALLIHW